MFYISSPTGPSIHLYFSIDPNTPLDGEDEGVSKCYPVSYRSNGKEISSEQIQVRETNVSLDW